MIEKKRIRAVIVDDEELSRNLLIAFLSDQSEIEIIASCTNGLEALQTITDLAPDLVFLDIQMPELDGLQVVKELGKTVRPLFIFITAHEKYALEAFELSAIDYLLKPFTKERFNKTLQKAISYFVNSKLMEFNEQVGKLLEVYSDLRGRDLKKDYLERILIKERRKLFLVPVKNVHCLQASGDYVSIHVNHKNHLINNSLNNLETQLDPRYFVRVHRSAIVNREKIVEFIPHFNGEYILVLENDMRVKLSRTYKHLFKELIGM